MKQLRNRKSPGEDQTRAVYLKHAGKKQESQYARGFKKSGKQVL